LREVRQARGIDLRDAAQQTRISIQFLKALEEEDFSKLPGEVFARGFLKSYAKFLHLDESDVMMKYAELARKQAPAVVPVPGEPPEAVVDQGRPSKMPIEPFLWGAGIIILLVLFLFTAFPDRRQKLEQRPAPPADQTGLASAPVPTTTPVKLYLEVIALENTWLLVRTDASPQKKAVLNKGESLIWSADERFRLSYGSAGAVKLLLNGQELVVNEPKDAVIRDLAVTASGIVDRNIQAERPRPARPKAQPAPGSRPTATGTGRQPESAPAPRQEQPAPDSRPTATRTGRPPGPAPAPRQEQPASAPAPQDQAGEPQQKPAQ
jgi:hypothetical protein